MESANLNLADLESADPETADWGWQTQSQQTWRPEVGRPGDPELAESTDLVIDGSKRGGQEGLTKMKKWPKLQHFV